MHRFIPVYADSVGAKILEVEVNHHPRKFGKAKYGLERTFKVLLDLVTVKFLSSYSNKPIYLFGGMGVGLIGWACSCSLSVDSQDRLGHRRYNQSFLPKPPPC
jgi:hypothetical protein